MEEKTERGAELSPTGERGGEKNQVVSDTTGTYKQSSEDPKYNSVAVGPCLINKRVCVCVCAQ